ATVHCIFKLAWPEQQGSPLARLFQGRRSGVSQDSTSLLRLLAPWREDPSWIRYSRTTVKTFNMAVRRFLPFSPRKLNIGLVLWNHSLTVASLGLAVVFVPVATRKDDILPIKYRHSDMVFFLFDLGFQATTAST
ncbi:unnamed protein product, partial [Aphanomyces euteiches]